MRISPTVLLCLSLILSGCQALQPGSSPGNDSELTAQPATASESSAAAKVPAPPAIEPAPASEPAAPAVEPAPANPPITAKPDIHQKLVIGEVEQVRVTPGNFVTDARIDTGATTTSIHAWDTVEFERDGQRWVKFKTLAAEGDGSQILERPITRIASIKRHGAEDVKRYAVRMRVTIGNISERIEVTLADRSEFDYKVLVGRNLLTDLFVVDVSKKHAAGNPSKTGK
ncbi:ATP-dependent zinc protease [Aestuariirhabdus litorea]|uniref:ATP-dependent Zn protease n=1 Tax=Aestuariirhabdus litorea TaxID=2528527 RepID=A0A3P3VQ36_9GAMM|nr:RimK/LysX family protein [Aestuariirhabdus litorea]RRJ84058.1 ATP-dependent Zn protease [Aestuariirhabdus litorea]RWW97278.1 ATP-dependent Zn protease [Endozoicomonadaceae bacterium GTF-13]